MFKFKVGDKVVRATDAFDTTRFQSVQGVKDYYIVTNISSLGNWLQLDDVVYRNDDVPWYAANFELYQEPDDELPPAPTSVSYLKDDGRRKLVAKITGGYVTLLLNLRKVSTLAYSLDPDAALQLAHDLRRMAMELKRKEKA